MQGEACDLGAKRRAHRQGIESEEIEPELGKRWLEGDCERLSERRGCALDQRFGLALVRAHRLDGSGEAVGNLEGQSLDVGLRRLGQWDEGERAAPFGSGDE